MASISTNEFRKIVAENVQAICEKLGRNFDKQLDRGIAFQYWVSDLLKSNNQGLETEIEDSILFSKDLGVDIILEDPDRKYILIAQSKYVGAQKKGSRPDLLESEVNDFFNKHKFLIDEKWVRDYGSQSAIEKLIDLSKKVNDGYSIDYYFVSTGNNTDRIESIRQETENHYKQADHLVSLNIFDFERLKDLYSGTLSLENSIPDHVSIPLSSNYWFSIDALSRQTIVCVVKGNTLVGLYRQYKHSLFAWNIRNYLGNKGINQEMKTTAANRPDDFFYFNNGISAICTDFQIINNKLEAIKFQIINGAQTVGALANAPDNEQIWVLLRVTKTLDVATEKGINSDIIRYNNTQNDVKVSDFRANDKLQIQIEQLFSKFKGGTVVPRIVYIRKRSAQLHNKKGKLLKIEQLGKIRYAFLYEPTIIHLAPNKLWDFRKNGGLYEYAFGVAGENVDFWGDDTFHGTLAVIALSNRINDEIKREKLSKPESPIRKTLQYHLIGMFGLYFRENGTDISRIGTDSVEFERVWDALWEKARLAAIIQLENSIEKGIAFYTFIKSDDYWEKMKKLFTASSANVKL